MPGTSLTMDELLLTHKQCTKCKIYKRLTEFSIAKQYKDGLTYWCKICINDRGRLLHYKNSQDPDWKASNANKRRIYKLSQEDQSGYRNAAKKYRDKNLHKVKAHAMVNTALENGSLIKQPCAICGAEQADGHHEDYSKPLEVIWLCRTHHREIHRKFNTIRERLGIPEHDRKL